MSLITIVIPCYNVEDKIKRCIDSIKKQTYQEFEVFLVDDGSTDHTKKIMKKEIEMDKRFQYFYKDNGGQASARNLGICKCNTEYITFIDSDDYVKSNYLLKLLEPFEQEQELDISACFFERIYETKTSVNTFDKEDLFFSKYPAVWGKVFRTRIIKDNKIHFPEGLWYEDLCFFTTVMNYSRKTHIVEESLYYYMQNPNSTMYTYSNKIFDIYKVFDIINKYVKNQERIEYIVVYHILIGTIFRASFKKEFDKEVLKEICEKVEKEYPIWYSNVNIKSQMPLFYRIYLYFLRKRQYGLVTLILKRFNKRLSL